MRRLELRHIYALQLLLKRASLVGNQICGWMDKDDAFGDVREHLVDVYVNSLVVGWIGYG